jgi:uncharacterized protein (TIGR02246 family)
MELPVRAAQEAPAIADTRHGQQGRETLTMRRLAIAISILVVGAPVVAAETCVTLEPKAVAALFDDWNFALSSLDASQVAQRYWPNAVLLPTASNTPRTTPAMVRDYFEHFLARRPRGHIDSRTIQGGCNLAMDMGTYTFSMMDDKGVTSEVAARYTFVYQYRDGGWKILHHHSSAMPEGAPNATPVDRHASSDAPAPPAAPVAAVTTAPAVPAAKPAPKSTPGPKSAPAAKPGPAGKGAVVAPVVAPRKEERTSMFANLVSSPPPAKFYPPEADKNKEKGTVNLRVCADGSGTISGTPEVVKSSGSKLLDQAAQTWAKAAKWIPATYNRAPVEGCTQVDVVFEAKA